MVLKKLTILAVVFSFTAWAFSATLTSVMAAPKTPPTTALGNDISWPQCGKAYPSKQAFGIVGVNGGTAANTNPCLSSQLSWASRSLGDTLQPKIQLYLNTANPGEVINQITTWPTSNTDKSGFTTNNPYGACSGANDLACSWQYGWNRAYEANVERFAPAAASTGINSNPAGYIWWLDVETMNTWQSGSNAALDRNVAALEGMAAYLKSKQATIGIYSTGYQWGVITGNRIKSNSSLMGSNSWLAGARNLKNAQDSCKNLPLLSGTKVTLTQFISGGYDYDYSCLG